MLRQCVCGDRACVGTGMPCLYFFALGSEGLREAHGGAKRAKHRAKRSPECADPNVVRGTP